ncbi:MAG TPA: 50S ribosomal protein L4 [Chloroflexia bacterium]|nr:50S ribosomal protein L4 [Chloroflexia bacterium]
MQATVYNLAGDEVEKIELDDTIFGITPNIAVIQQAVLRQQANARQGTHETLTRAHVRGGGRKPWRQKGTGRARQGSTRSPQWAHGGVVFGPHLRSYEQDMPRKMRRLAIRGVLSAKAAEGKLVLVDSFTDIEPRTKAMTAALGKLNVNDNSALIMVPENEPNLTMAAGNLPRVKLMLAGLLSVVDMLKYDYLVLPRASVDLIQSILGNGGGRRKLALRRNGSSAPTSTSETSADAGDEIAASNIAFAPTAEVAQVAEASIADAEATEAEVETTVEPSDEPAAPKTRKRKPKSEEGSES